MQFQEEQRIRDLERRLHRLEQGQAVWLQDRLFIGLTNDFDVQQHGLELLEHMKRTERISFCSNDFTLLSFRGTAPDPIATEEPPIWETIVSPIYSQLRNTILSVINLRHVGITCDGGGCIYCILNFAPNTQDFYEEVTTLCRQINQLSEKRHGFSFRVSISELGQGISSLPELKRQVHVLDEYRTAMGGHVPELLFYDQVVSPNQEYPVFVRTMNEQFNAYLDSGEFSCAKQFFRETIVPGFLSPPPPANLIRIRLTAMIDYLIQSLYRSCDALGLGEVLQELAVSKVLPTCTGIDALVPEMERIFDVLADRWGYTGSPAHQLAQSARSFINDNYTDPNLNVNQVAATLNVSPTHLTRTFRACYQCGVLEYLQRTRLAAAKRLLGSERALCEIALQVGYGSSLNMSRAFKRYEGSTPSEYLQKKRT